MTVDLSLCFAFYCLPFGSILNSDVSAFLTIVNSAGSSGIEKKNIIPWSDFLLINKLNNLNTMLQGLSMSLYIKFHRI